MKHIFEIITKYSIKTIVFIWDFIFFFFGMPYEKQASKLKLDKLDPTLRGRENEKTTHKVYRAKKVSKGN
ncbi:MAG: hypothetical protein M1300_05540 [Epsilonproteobacteria bacterium]|nr:hypothetical protein [Campylobacterota bacterium]